MWLANFLCVQKSPPIAAPSVILVPGPCSCLRVSDEVASGKDHIPMLARLAGVGWKSSRTSVRLTPWKSASRASGIQGFRRSRPGSADELAGGDMPRCSASLPASGVGFAPGQPCQRRDRAFRPGGLASITIGLSARTALPASPTAFPPRQSPAIRRMFLSYRLKLGPSILTLRPGAH